jgi:molecular chaperone DnaK
VERRLGELGQAVAVHEKARAETLVADARQAINEQAPLDRLRSLTSELQQIYQSLGAAGSGPGPSGGGPSGPGSPGQPPGDDDVIDAEFTTHD